MRRRRGLSRRFGSVVKRKNHNGVPTCLLARYPSPKEPGERVVRRFPLGAEALAYAWLDGEEGFVRDYERGLSDWVPPEERERVVKLAREDFAVYAEDFLDSYRTVDGGRAFILPFSILRVCWEYLLPFADNFFPCAYKSQRLVREG